MTPKLFVMDLIKGVLVAFALGAPFLSAFIWVFKWAGDRFVPWLMAFLYVFLAVLYLTFFADVISLLGVLFVGFHSNS